MATTNERYPELSGRVVVVTGASKPIGAGTARAFAAQGATVVVTGRNRPALDALIESINATSTNASPTNAGQNNTADTIAANRAIAVTADLTDEADVARLAAAAAALGPVEVVCAFAGGEGRPVNLVDLDLATFRSTVEVNLTATFLTLRAFLPGLLDRGRGSIITMASTAGRQVSPASPAYGAAKAGVLMLTRQAALQVAPHGVRINAIALGSVLDGKPVPQAQRDEIARFHPLGRTGTPEDVAGVTLFLASDTSSWMTGATLDLNGGRIMQ